MKIVNTIKTLVIISLAAAGVANANNYKAGDDTMESKLCVSAATSSEFQMTSKIKFYLPGSQINRKYQLVANNVSCNGLSIAEFAADAGNYEVANKLASYQKKNAKIHDLANKSNGNVVVTDV